MTRTRQSQIVQNMRVGQGMGGALLALGLSVLGATPAQAAPHKKIAVPNMQVTGADPNLGQTLTGILTTEAANYPGVSVISASDISEMLGFQKQKDLMGCSGDVSCIAEIGGALGVDLLLVSQLGLVGQTYVLNLKLIDTRDVTVLKRIYRTISGKPDDLIQAVHAAVPQLMAVVLPNAKPVAAAAGAAHKGSTAAANTTPPRTGTATSSTAAPTRPASKAIHAAASPTAAHPTQASGAAPTAVHQTAATVGRTVWPMWTLMGVGAAVLAAGGVAEIIAFSLHNQSTIQLPYGGPGLLSTSAGGDRLSAAKTSRAALGLALGGVAIAGGGLLWLLLSGHSTATAPHAGSTSLTYVPWLAPHAGGWVVEGQW